MSCAAALNARSIYTSNREHMSSAHSGLWREVDNHDELTDEVRAYGEARRLLRLYTMLLQQIFKHRGDVSSVAAVDAVARTITGLPQEPDLMHGFYVDSPAGPWVWQFHRVYLEFSQTDTRSRTAYRFGEVLSQKSASKTTGFARYCSILPVILPFRL